MEEQNKNPQNLPAETDEETVLARPDYNLSLIHI